MPELDFARAVGLVLAVPILVIVLVGVHLAWQHRPKQRGRIEPWCTKCGSYHAPGAEHAR